MNDQHTVSRRTSRRYVYKQSTDLSPKQFTVEPWFNHLYRHHYRDREKQEKLHQGSATEQIHTAKLMREPVASTSQQATHVQQAFIFVRKPIEHAHSQLHSSPAVRSGTRRRGRRRLNPRERSALRLRLSQLHLRLTMPADL